MQVPPFWHGLDWQSSMSEEKKRGREEDGGGGVRLDANKHTKRHLFKTTKQTPFGDIRPDLEKIIIKAN